MMASPFETDRMRRGQRRNEGYEDVENIPDNSSLRAKTSHNQISRLESSLTIIASFENVEALTRTVREALDFPATGKFVINFKSHSLMPALRMSTCKFEIVTNNEVSVAEKCVEDMVARLRDDLKTVVEYKTYRDKNGNEQVKELCSSEPQGALSKLANKKNSPVGKGKEIQTMVFESSNISDKVEEPARFNQIKRFFESIAPKDVLFQETLNCKPTTVECRAGVSHPDGNYRPAVPNDLKIQNTLENPTQTIEDHDKEKRGAQNSGARAEFATFPNKNSVSDKSKNGSQKINTINESQYTKKLRNHEAGNASGNEMLAWRSRIEKVLSKMEEKKSKVLVKHDEKIAAIRSDIRNWEEEVKGRKKAEKDAVVDKLTEACNQRMEYFCKCNILSIKVQELKPSITAEQELYRVQEDFGVECKRLTNALPIYARRDDIVNHVKSNQVSIILGETGSGKSTQIAQYLYEAGINVCGDGGGGKIVCTQPRKVAVVQLADRVAQEMVVVAGDLVGYKTGNKRKMNDNTKIVFMTDHSLLNECLEDRDFLKYSCIIVDEAHERSIYTDILLGMIKACLNRRPDLRVVITSATIDPQVFIDYFQCPKEISVSGRTFPVEVFYTESSDDFENYETKAVSKAAEIHRTQPAGDILVFLTSPVEIQRCCEEFCKMFEGKDDFKCLPLHGQLLPEEQKEVFAKLNGGVRKVVFATNCAETSITIDGIKYVIDTGVSKEMRYDAKKNLNLLGVHMISQSSANQRKGRAGRTASGKCYRLFSQEGYYQMRTINEPEILRVHLGQAILKLADLGVNIRDYDFVESPSDSALQAALEMLEFLGAIGNEKITDLGRWISKLPFDPKLGYIVYKAKDEELLYDAIVLASVISNGSGLFYRGLTETEAQISARCKVEFGLESGDIFTWFAIYKMWEAIPAIQEKRRWCKFNCINNKSMTYTKACIDEVIPTLNREMRLDIVKQFSGDEPSAVTVLSKLMLRAYGLSLCHFMGHSRAGYFSLESQRQVHLHPSSTLVAQNFQPEWLVFVELVKTSREFIKGILAVNEEWIQDAVDEGHLRVDITKAKEQTLSVVHKEEVGMSVFKAMVGPRYSGIQSLEELCEAHGMKHSILEADRELGTVSIYSSSGEIHPGVLNKLKEVKSDAVLALEEEESECRFLNKESNDPPNIRAVVGSGACVRQVLMPHQTAEVLLRKVGDATEEDILLKFSEFGTIVRTISFKSMEPWGFIRYRTVDEAAVACERTKQDQRMAGSPKLDRGPMNARNVLQAKVAWIRRPVKGKGMAFIKCDPMDKADLVGKSIFINGGFQSLKPSKKRETFAGPNDSAADFVVHNIGNTVEETLRQLIIHGIMNGDNVDLKVTILREKAPTPTHEELEDMRVRLKTHIDPDGVENFNIRLIAPKPGHVHQIGFLYFTDPVRGLRVCQRQNRRINMASEPVIITPTLRTTIIVPKKIKDVCEEEMNDLFIEMKRDLGVDLEWKPLKEDFAINIKCENPEGIVQARECITEKLKGDPIDCNEDKSRLCLLTTAGQCLITQTQQNTGCLIISDKRTKIIHLYGQIKQVSDAKNQINAYVTENKDKREMIIRLKSYGKPPGLMKSLMNKFGPLLDGLIRDYKLSSVSLDCRSHTMKCLGSEESVQALDEYISSLQNELFKSNPRAGIIFNGNNCLPECVVCMDDVESKEDLYRLEACGHPYCVPCLQHQTLACVQSNQFPLVCAQEHCGQELVWKDVRYIFTNKWIAEEKLVNSSLNHLVSSQPEKFKFCPTPNCSVVYKVTVDEDDGCEFNCAACFASTCSSCHVAFHTGVTCKMAKSGSGAEGNLSQWVAEDPKKRKICPGCNVPIEKIEGCNKMHCTGCHTVFCWICREKFPSEGSCYDHLTKHHSGIFDVDAY